MLPPSPSEDLAEQPLQIIIFLDSLASSALLTASCCSQLSRVCRLLSPCTSLVERADAALGRETFAGRASSFETGPRPSQAACGPAVGTSQVVPNAQHPASARAATTNATHFEIITAPTLFYHRAARLKVISLAPSIIGCVIDCKACIPWWILLQLFRDCVRRFELTDCQTVSGETSARNLLKRHLIATSA